MTRGKQFIATTILAATLATLTCQALAATDGTLGATSTATSTVSLTIPQRYQITGISDFAFGNYSGSGDLTSNDDVCVYTNDSTRQYKVRITDSSSLSPSGFSVQNAAGTAHIAYTVKWNNQSGTNGNQNVSYNSHVNGENANNSSASCNGARNANLQVNVAQAALQAASGGAYSTTLTVVIEPS